MNDETLLIDLHSHTTASDGHLSPSALIARALERNIDVFAITDHDTTSGLEEAHQYNNQQLKPLKLINGVEISTHWHNFDIHVVALNIDIYHPILQEFLAEQRQRRALRAREIGIRLEKAGITNAYEGTKLLAGNAAISRGHYARFLVDNGYEANIANVFKRYVKRKNGIRTE